MPPRRLTMPSRPALQCPDFLQQQKCTIAPASTSVSTATSLRSHGQNCATVPPAARRGPGALAAFLRPRLVPSPPPPARARAHGLPPMPKRAGWAPVHWPVAVLARGDWPAGPGVCAAAQQRPPVAMRTAALVGACGHGLVFCGTSQSIKTAVNSARPGDPMLHLGTATTSVWAVLQSGDSHPETC